MGKYKKLGREELRAMHRCYGHFYTLKVSSAVIVPCRSVLEIVKASSDLKEVQMLSTRKPNATVIMMNPGGSEPLEPRESEDIIEAENFNIKFRGKLLADASPDETQDRIMNVMAVLGWEHVRILNLSDVREVDSDFLDRHLDQFNVINDSSIHSIFSDARSGERTAAFCGNNTPLIMLGWGTKQYLKPAARYALHYINQVLKAKYIGIKQRGCCYYHPGRRKNWHNDIIDQIYEAGLSG